MPKTAPFERYPERYEAWFTKYPAVYDAELRAVRALLPKKGLGLEVGVGTGRFAAPVEIKMGVDPSHMMAKAALLRGIHVIGGVAEDLPLKHGRFDFVLMVTTVCFPDDILKAFREAWRVLKKAGFFVVGLVDRVSPLVRIYLARQNENVFYRVARFYSVAEIVQIMQQIGFRDFNFRQTIFRGLSEVTSAEPVFPGHSKGAFVAVRCQKGEI